MSGLWQNPAIVDKWCRNTKSLKRVPRCHVKKRDLWIIGDGVHFERDC